MSNGEIDDGSNKASKVILVAILIVAICLISFMIGNYEKL